MPKPNQNFTVKEMKDYIRTKKINHPNVKLTMKRADMIAGLKSAGHWDEKDKVKKARKKPAPKPKVSSAKKATPKKETPKPKVSSAKNEKPSLKDILLDLDIDVSKKIAEAVEKDKKIDYYEITGGSYDEMMDMRKSFKPDGKKDIFGSMPKWIDGVTNGNAGTTGTLTRAKARQIKNKYKNLTIKRFVETDKAPYYKLEDV